MRAGPRSPETAEPVESIAVFRQAQDWLREQVERELVDLFTSEDIVIDRAGVSRVTRHTDRIAAPFVVWIGTGL